MIVIFGFTSWEKGHRCGRAQPRTGPDGPSGQGAAGIARWAGEGTGCPEALATGRALDLQPWASGSEEGGSAPRGMQWDLGEEGHPRGTSWAWRTQRLVVSEAGLGWVLVRRWGRGPQGRKRGQEGMRTPPAKPIHVGLMHF